MSRSRRTLKVDELHRVEREKWDELAPVRLTDADRLPSDADFESRAAHSITMRGVVDFLGDLHGRRVLEIGSGTGELTCLLARSGAVVDALDISPASVEAARRRAELNDVTGLATFHVAVAEDLPFEDERFDIVFGKAVLHHLNLEHAQPELRRVLRAGGRAAFSEPLGMNPVLTFARARLPYPGKRPRGADRPLTYDEIRAWGQGFSHAEHHEIQLVSALERVVGRGPFRTLRRMDDLLLARISVLRPLARYVVILMEK